MFALRVYVSAMLIVLLASLGSVAYVAMLYASAAN